MYKNVYIEELHLLAKDLKDIIIEQKKSSVVVYIDGPMGAGKTTFVKAFAKEIGIKGEVQSPTFTIMREYEIQDADIIQNKLLHVDAYRFETKSEGDILELNSLLKSEEKVLIFIEWPQNMNAPRANVIVNINKAKDENIRSVTFKIIKTIQ